MTKFVWIGPIGRFNVTNDLGTAANWAPVSVPTATARRPSAAGPAC